MFSSMKIDRVHYLRSLLGVTCRLPLRLVLACSRKQLTTGRNATPQSFAFEVVYFRFHCLIVQPFAYKTPKLPSIAVHILSPIEPLDQPWTRLTDAWKKLRKMPIDKDGAPRLGAHQGNRTKIRTSHYHDPPQATPPALARPAYLASPLYGKK